HGHKEYPEDVLCIDIGGATVLEQVLFNKMMLFSSFYHHQKVRASFRLLVRILELMRKSQVSLRGTRIDKASDFLLLDDGDVLSAETGGYPPELKQLIADLRGRRVPKRALVITKDVLLDDESRAEYFRLRHLPQTRVSWEEEISRRAGGVQPVFIDFPEEPGFAVSGLHSLVKLAPRRYVTLDVLYPASGWVSGYAEYRYRSYIFSPEGKERAVHKVALEVFGDKNIRLDKSLSSDLAKLPSP
ncbi:MAG: hypothetical protein H8D32_04925, partial [Dehalococcoidia bacterium]|nr:hypothetical protein [Dehalococcoidia bacterium]